MIKYASGIKLETLVELITDKENRIAAHKRVVEEARNSILEQVQTHERIINNLRIEEKLLKEEYKRETGDEYDDETT